MAEKKKSSKAAKEQTADALKKPLNPELRSLTENKLHKQSKKKRELSYQLSPELIHELQVHQIELEMQNEELRRAQEDLEESRSKYVDLYDFAPVGYFTLDKKGVILEVNLTGASLLGIERNSLVKKHFPLFVHRNDQDKFNLHCQAVLQTKTHQTTEIRLKRKDSNPFYAHLECLPVQDSEGNIVIIRAVISDITKRKKAEAALKITNTLLEISNKHDKFKPLLNDFVKEIQKFTGCSAVGIRILDEEGNIPYQAYTGFNREFYEMESPLSIKSDQCMCINVIKKKTNPEQASFTEAGSFYTNSTTKLLATVSEREIGQTRNMCNAAGFESVMLIPIVAGDKVLGLIHIADRQENNVPIDMVQVMEQAAAHLVISMQRVNAEEELKKHREHLMELVEERTLELQTSYERLEKVIADRLHAEEQLKLMALFAELNPSPVIRFNIRGKVLMANPAAVDILNMGSRTGIHLTSLIPDTKGLDLTACIRNSKILLHFAQIGNKHFHFIFRGIPHLDIGHVYGSDITEQKIAEAEAIRADHLASLGELAAGVAHEINNPINGIINYTQILVNKSKQGSKENDIARRIIKEGDRIAGIVNSLLSFAHDSKDEKVAVHIGDIMSDSLALTETQLKKDGIKLRVSMPSNLPKIIAQPQQIEQVFLNIISNARYALNQKYSKAHKNKTLDISGEKITINNNSYIRITFHDQGTGISYDLQDKIINPFFSTKPSGIGTGLGLSISHSIISDHGGKLKIYSIEGEFTRAIINLPTNTEIKGEN